MRGGPVHLLPPQVSNSSIYLGDAAPKRVRNETYAKTVEHEGVASQIDERPPARYTSATRMIIVAGHPLLSAPGSTTPTPAPGPAGRAVVIGNFDGVHRGHRALLRTARGALDEAGGGELSVLTFWPHPARFLAPERAPPLLCTRDERRALLAAAGVDLLVEETFDAAFAAMSPAAFVDEVLCGALGASVVCVGYDFTFGRGRAGTTASLQDLLARRGARLAVVPAVSVALQPEPAGVEDEGGAEEVVCSSTRVRAELAAGRVTRAAQLLGRPPTLSGTIVPGAGRGRGIGVPTANLALAPLAEGLALAPGDRALPAIGVYAAWATLDAGDAGDAGEQAGQGAQVKRYPAAVDVGYNPTFTASPASRAAGAESGDPGQAGPRAGGPVSTLPITIEAHLIQPAGALPLPALYGRGLRIELVARLRAERRFPSVGELVAQIRTDIKDAAQLLSAPPGRGV